MIKNHLKAAWRTMVKDKTYATINILGLTIGLAACMLVFTVVIDELSYDKFWSRAGDLYKVNMSDKMADGLYKKNVYTPVGLGYGLKESFPEMEHFSSINTNELQLRIGDDDQDGIRLNVINADTNALAMLNFQVLSGQLVPFVAGHQNLVITESFRKRHFEGEDPIGKVVEDVPSWSNKSQSYLITAVIKDIPPNTHLRADAIALTKPSDGGDLTKAGIRGGTSVYYLLKPGTDARVFTNKINTWFRDFTENPTEKKGVTFDLQPMTDVYLHSDFNGRQQVKGNIRTIYILSGVGGLLLLIACINFVNLSLARAMKRLKETGVRKILGAERKQLVAQFITESLLFFVIGIGLAIGLYALGIPVVESFLSHDLAGTLLSSLPVFALTLLVVFTLSIATGAYPAWIVSGFKPANTLRGKVGQNPVMNTAGLRKALVVTQFTISIVVLVALLVVRQQVDYLTHKDIGYNKESLLHIGLRNWEGKGETFKTELTKQPGIEAASIAGWNLVNGSTGMSGTIDHPLKEGEKIDINYIIADFDFAQTLGFELQEGRLLDAAYGTDAYDLYATMGMDKEEGEQYKNTRSSLVTASTARMLGIKETGVPIPKLGYSAVGILKDFHHESLHHSLGPVFILGQQNPNYAYLFIRTTPGMEQQAQQSLVKLWKEFYPNRLLDAQWVTDILDKQYEAEQKQQALFSFFSGLMLFLSAMGVFGLIVHAAQQRVKEIGIRKVLGASVAGIVRLLSTDFVKLVLIAVVVASPVAWWIMNKWLEDFAYRIDIQWWMFAAAGVVAVLIALATVSWQAIRAAIANPVDSLRDE
ncbi:FtsX-like permease family protein [Parapedobacter koreensis]|uniref:Putative ABC transport system permease protein n=1 Tax=Parapedobacter koreensis TaxID=332977 RepID=A0A1H7QZS9_9SPHI|nr:FtsX-like permease family protein [Parapedobacter koreensis]SEL53174.1 putative ABC transport system permease protein [Parapedobacter koreensis]